MSRLAFLLCQPLAFLPKSERIALQLFILVDCLNSLSINKNLWKAQILVLNLKTIRIQQIVNIQKIGYDKWNATQWAIHATELGLPLEEYPQTMSNFNRPTKEMERLILSGDVVIDNNEITRWCFRNVELKSDYNGNVKPNKSLKSKKIDGAIAMIQALGTYLTVPHYSNEITVI